MRNFECTRFNGETWERDGLRVTIKVGASFDVDPAEAGEPLDQNVSVEVSTASGLGGSIEVESIADLYEIAQIIARAAGKDAYIGDICANEPPAEDYE